jgi:hypothetical protein
MRAVQVSRLDGPEAVQVVELEEPADRGWAAPQPPALH